MNIAFNVNKLGMEGLGATLVSLIRNCSDNSQLVIWFFCSGLDKGDKKNISALLESECFFGGVKYVDFSAEECFGNLRSLHGDWTTYGRLLIPKTIGVGKVLYLDGDLIIDLDVLQLRHIKSDKALAAVGGTTVKWSQEHVFFIEKLKFSPDVSYFNAGVLLFDIEKWNESGFDKKVEKYSIEYPNEFLSADQTLQNAICEGDFYPLPPQYNIPWYPNNLKPESDLNGIIHYVGSPKPWDLLGSVIHHGYTHWSKYDTSLWQKKYGGFSIGKLRRTWKIRRSTLRTLKSSLTNK